MHLHKARHLLESLYQPGSELNDIHQLIQRCPDEIFHSEFANFVTHYMCIHHLNDVSAARYHIANAWGNGKPTPLVAAILAGKKIAASTLIDAGARVNESTGPYDTRLFALGAAVSQKQYDIVSVLLEAGANANASNSAMPHSFITAFDDTAMIQLLSKYGASIIELKARHPKVSEHTLRCVIHSLRGLPPKEAHSSKHIHRSRL